MQQGSIQYCHGAERTIYTAVLCENNRKWSTLWIQIQQNWACFISKRQEYNINIITSIVLHDTTHWRMLNLQLLYFMIQHKLTVTDATKQRPTIHKDIENTRDVSLDISASTYPLNTRSSIHLNYTRSSIHLNYTRSSIHLNYTRSSIHLNYTRSSIHLNYTRSSIHLNTYFEFIIILKMGLPLHLQNIAKPWVFSNRWNNANLKQQDSYCKPPDYYSSLIVGMSSRCHFHQFIGIQAGFRGSFFKQEMPV
jgi:hypothetical protein